MIQPFISICIPAYKNEDFLQRLLQSISIQHFRDFEVVITDDSTDNSIENLLAGFRDKFPFVYHKNVQQLGSPANWNKSIELAKGKWIKIMHDDDWFADAGSLQRFAELAKNGDQKFIFSGYNEIELETLEKRPFVIRSYQKKILKQSPLNLFKENFIGHPSTTLILNNEDLLFDIKLKWVVDFEFYIRYLLKIQNDFSCIDETLINIGISKYQITKEAFRNPDIEIYEAIYLFYKLPPRSLRNIFLYDYYWRLMRNLSIRKPEDLYKYARNQQIPVFLKKIVHFQSLFSEKFLKIGFVSKMLMSVHYLLFKNS